MRFYSKGYNWCSTLQDNFHSELFLRLLSEGVASLKKPEISTASEDIPSFSGPFPQQTDVGLGGKIRSGGCQEVQTRQEGGEQDQGQDQGPQHILSSLLSDSPRLVRWFYSNESSSTKKCM